MMQHPWNSQIQSNARKSKARFLALVGAAILLFLMLSLVAGLPIYRSLEQQAGQAIQATLRGDVAQFQSWMQSRKWDVQRFTEHNLTAIRDRLREGQGEPSRMELEQLSPRYLGWILLDSNRMTLATNLREMVGQEIPVVDSTWAQLPRRAPFIAWPFRVPFPTTEPNLDQVIMGVVAPVVEGGKPIGAIMLLLDPTTEFGRCLKGNTLGATGESIIFGPTAQLIYSSRSTQSRRHQKPSPPKTNSDAKPALSLGTTLRNKDGSLTTIADQATRGGTGVALSGVNDYQNRFVMAAWQWLPEPQIGMAVKLEIAEVMTAWRRLCWAWIGCLASMATIGTIAYRQIDRTPASRVAGTAAKQLGQYQLHELIGQGGMGAVYRGTHQLLKREVAIKVLEARNTSVQSASRFEREVQMTARLRHPNTIDIYDYNRTAEGTFFYVMEFVDGINLQELIDQFGSQSPSRVIHLLLQICGSLAEAHQAGMVHRDIKPSNILVTARAGLYDMVKVLDFGLVKNVNDAELELTQTDGITGTPMYMSPESIRDAAMADHRSDLYSVGAVGYTLLTGLPTFDGDSSVDVCLKQLKEMPLRPAERLGRPLPDDLQNVLMNCLQKDPDERPRTIEDLQSALLQCSVDEWTRGDALHWWEIEFQKNGNKLTADSNHPRNLMNKRPKKTAGK